MGFHVVWRAVRGMEIDEVLKHLMLAPTEEREPFPESARACAVVGDWSIVVYSERDAWPDGEPTSLVSSGADVVQTGFDETTGCAEVSLWRGSRLIANAARGDLVTLDALQATGPALAEFPSGRQLLGSVADGEEPESDPLEAIVELACEITGYRHDKSGSREWVVCVPDRRPLSSRW